MVKRKKRKERKERKPQKVILKTLPPGFIDDLPMEDQIAISEVVGKPITLTKYEKDGRAVLEFTDKQGDFHGLYVDPKHIEPW